MKLFPKPGKDNTLETLQIAVCEAKQRGIQHLVVASGSGETIRELLKLDVEGLHIICVTSVCGFKEPGKMSMKEETRRILSEQKVDIVTTTHALSGGERALSNKFSGVYPVEIIAHTLRLFGQGTKVCMEICLMAADCGAIPYGSPVIAVGGTAKGADTAIVLRPAHTANLFGTKFDEFLCKPLIP